MKGMKIMKKKEKFVKIRVHSWIYPFWLWLGSVATSSRLGLTQFASQLA